ncbi:MAG: extracellular solute-binding protein [Caldilineaceae bacterium]
MSSKVMSRRQFLVASGAVVGAGVLAACAPVAAPQGGAQSSGGATQAGKTLVFASQYAGPPLNAGDDEIIKQFKEANPHITINKTVWPNQDFHDKLRLLATAGDLPDVFNMETKQLPDMISRNMILDITELFNANGKLTKDDYFASEWDKQWFKGKMYLLSLDTQDVILFYNKDLFDKKGIAYPPKKWDDPNWTYDKLIEIGQKLTEGEGAGKVFGFETSRWWPYTYPLIWSYGGMVTNEDHTESKMTMDKTIAAFQLRADLINKYKIAPSPAEETEGVDTLFSSGHLAMRAIWNPWMFSLKDVPNLHFDIAAMPSGPAGAFTRGPQDGFAVGGQSKNPNEAFQFAMFAAGPTGQELMCSKLGLGTPTLKKVAQLDSFIHPPVKGLEHIDQSLVLEIFNGGHSKHQDVTVKWPEMDKMISAESDSLLDGKVTAEEFCKKLDPQINELLQSIPAEQRGWIGD